MHRENIRMPRWLVALAVVGLMFAVMTPAAVEAATPLNAQYFSHSGDIYVPTTINDSAIAAAVAAPNDGKFIQMGPESSITMMFPIDYYALPDGTSAPDLRVDIWDDIYPALAEVLLSGDGVNYWSEGLFEDTANIDLDVGEIVKYVKIIQPLACDPGVPIYGTTTDSGFCIDQRASHLGFDLDAVVALNAGEPEPTTSCPPGERFVNSFGSWDNTPIENMDVNDGHFYDITASGWFYAGGWSTYGGIAYKDIRADAEFSETRYARVNAKGWTETPGTADGDPYLALGYAEEYFDLLVNFDGSLEPVDWGEYSTDHTYTIQRMATTGTMQFQFRVNEGYAQNDVGGLCVSLFMVNRPPVADPNGPYLVAVNGTTVFDGSGSSDADGDPLTFDWTVSGGAVNDPSAVLPVYTAPATAGIHDVTLSVDDDNGGIATETTTVVVYDPADGFVTGGGWIDSPAGAYKDDPSLTGKATFGFISKYKKGAAVPTGNTEFQFHAGDLNFHSTSYDWLVVTGVPTAMFKGEGTINGEGPYKFMITAGDGETDTFRIAIWDDNGIVYDNGSNQDIGAGSIIIHTKNK